jgi:hypothetical protein
MKRKFKQMLILGMLFLFSGHGYSQIRVSGVVTSNTGELLPGVTILVKGTTQGVTTNLDGQYSINVPGTSSVLVFSFVGMQSQEITVGNKAEINVTLAPSTIGVDEVVVTALGIKREKKALGYSVGEVKGEDLQRVTQTNVLSAL